MAENQEQSSSNGSETEKQDLESATVLSDLINERVNGTELPNSSISPRDNEHVGKPRRSSILNRSGSGTARPPRVKKSVSFCSMPEDRRVSNARDCLSLMQDGTELTKLKPNGRLYRRYYWLDDNLTEIRWMPTSKKYNKAKIQVDQIKEVQSGKNSDALKNKDLEAVYQEEYTLTILYGSNYSPLDLAAKSPDEANIWIAGLNHLISKRDQNPNNVDEDEGGDVERRATIRDRWLAETFAEQAGTVEDILPEFEVINLILKMNPAVDIQYVNQKLKELYSIDRPHSKGVLDCDEFITLYKDVASRQEIYFLMTKYGSSDDYMNAEDLMLFLETEQGMCDVSKKYCEELIVQYEPSREGRAKLMLGIDGLLTYLLSSDCDIFNQKFKDITQDMTQPLSNYFINSSHKTYLLEDQLKGPSSAAAYSRALKHGCRYVEVDCWDGPSEPVVYHGRTLTSKILFSDVLDAIRKHAFQVTPYPLILSIENHCSLEYQRMMVSHLKAKLGDALYTTPINGNSFVLPSPDELKYKILIKCKKLDDTNQDEIGEVSDEDESLDPDWRKLNRKTVFKQRPKSQHCQETSRKISMLRELSDLVNWCQSCTYDKFWNQRNQQKPWHVISVSDLYAQKLMQSNADEFLACNRHGLTRVYPNCSRVDSSNFNPQEMWNYGCQIVALNQQSQGPYYDLNAAKFKQNGSCGYVLKPPLLCDNSVYFNPQSVNQQSLPGITPQVVQIKVISGHRFPKPRGSGTKSHITDPYVYLEIFGVSADCNTARTKTVSGNGQNPFYDESFTFYIHFPELAMIRFNILDDDFIGDEFIAQYTIPFTCIKTGFRHINLLSSSGEKIPGCTLFVHVTSTDAFDKKPMKRGTVASSKLKIVKEPIVIKPVGMKPVDELSKCLLTSLTELADLRYSVENSLVKFKEACDVGSVANIKYCIRTIANRASNTKGLTLKLINNLNMPMLVISEGSPPEILKRALQAYLFWCNECKTLIEKAETKKAAVLEIEKMLLSLQSEMSSYMEEASLSEKKSQKALDNFAWNMRILKDQLSLSDQYTECCKNYFVKVVEAAAAAGIEISNDTKLAS